MVLNMTLYKNSKENNVRTDLNLVENTLEKLKAKKKIDYKIINTNVLSESQIIEAYSKTIGPSVFNKYKVRKIFGTNRQSGIFFGKEQPALFVEGDLWDVYPHERDNKIISIEKFLSNLLKTTD